MLNRTIAKFLFYGVAVVLMVGLLRGKPGEDALGAAVGVGAAVGALMILIVLAAIAEQEAAGDEPG